MALADMQRVGSNAYGARLAELGYARWEIAARLAERFPGQPTSSIYAAADAGIAAYRAGIDTLTYPEGERITPRGAPSGGYGGRGYRYYVNVTTYNNTEGTTRVRTVVVDSSRGLTRQELLQQIELQSAQSRVRGRGMFGSEPVQLQETTVGEDIFAVERLAS